MISNLRRRYFDICSVVALLAIAGCVSTPDGSQPLSIEQLLAHPGKFDGRAVVVIAYANIEFEGDELCDLPSSPGRPCIWLTYDDGPYETERDWARYQAADKKWRALHGKRVLVSGTFHGGRRGHFGMYPGEISYIAGVKLAP